MPVNFIAKGPKFRTADQLALDGTYPISAEMIRKIAKQHDVGRKAGRTYLFSDADVLRLYEVMSRPSNSSSDRSHQTGSSAAPSGEFALKRAQALPTSARPWRSKPSAKRRYRQRAFTAKRLRRASPTQLRVTLKEAATIASCCRCLISSVRRLPGGNSGEPTNAKGKIAI